MQEKAKNEKHKLKHRTSKNNRKSTLELAVREIRVDLRDIKKELRRAKRENNDSQTIRELSKEKKALEAELGSKMEQLADLEEDESTSESGSGSDSGSSGSGYETEDSDSVNSEDEVNSRSRNSSPDRKRKAVKFGQGSTRESSPDKANGSISSSQASYLNNLPKHVQSRFNKKHFINANSVHPENYKKTLSAIPKHMEMNGGFRRGSLTGKNRNTPEKVRRTHSKIKTHRTFRRNNEDDIVNMYKKYTERRKLMERSSNWFHNRPSAHIPVNSYYNPRMKTNSNYRQTLKALPGLDDPRNNFKNGAGFSNPSFDTDGFSYSDFDSLQPNTLMTVDGNQLRRTVDRWLQAPKHSNEQTVAPGLLLLREHAFMAD